MKPVRPFIPTLLATALVLCALGLSATGQNPPVSGCVTCHTDVKKLIRLGWEVERVRGKAPVSAETEGEG